MSKANVQLVAAPFGVVVVKSSLGCLNPSITAFCKYPVQCSSGGCHGPGMGTRSEFDDNVERCLRLQRNRLYLRLLIAFPFRRLS
jgi:hypothetical protein